MVAIRADESVIYPKYLFAVLRSCIIQQEIENLHVGSLIPHFKKGDFNNLHLPIVNDKLQKFIGDFYFNLSYKMDLLYRQNKILEALAQTYFRQWFIEKRNNCKLADVIVEHKKSTIQVRYAKEIINGKYPFFTSGIAILNYNDYLVDGRNIFLNIGGNADVKFYIGKAAFSTDTWCLHANEYTDYIYLLLSGMVDEIDQNYFMGTALQHLQKGQLKELQIYIPNNIEIINFNKIIYPMFDKIDKNKMQIQTLQKLSDTLLPKLISGEVRVKQ